jgi:hypothetical protein
VLREHVRLDGKRGQTREQRAAGDDSDLDHARAAGPDVLRVRTT